MAKMKGARDKKAEVGIIPTRDEKGRFVKGMPNPIGRKALPENIRGLFESSTKDAAETIIGLMNDVKVEPNIRLKASEIVLDRVYGKVAQAIHANVENNVNTTIDLSGLTVDQLLKIANMDVEKDVIDVSYSDIELENNSD